jgi:hypothetical protein
MSNVAELRTEVAKLKDTDAKQEVTIQVLAERVGGVKDAVDRIEGKLDGYVTFQQKLVLGLVGVLGTVVLAVLGLLGANPELIKTAKAAVAP